MNLTQFAKKVNKINWSQPIKRKQALLFHYFIINGATDKKEYLKVNLNYTPKNWRIFEFNVSFDEKEKDKRTGKRML